MQLDRPLAVVTSSVDGDVLTALARAGDARMTTGQMQRVLQRWSAEGLRKSLSRLVDQGIVLVEAAGNTRTYRLNRDHLAAGAVDDLARTKDRFVALVRDHVAGWPPGVRFAALFGSAATGEMRPDSDIDLLVVHDDSVNWLEWDERHVDLQLRVLRWTGNPLSAVLMPVAELRARRSDRLVTDVGRQGITVAGSRDWFDRETRSRRADA